MLWSALVQETSPVTQIACVGCAHIASELCYVPAIGIVH